VSEIGVVTLELDGRRVVRPRELDPTESGQGGPGTDPLNSFPGYRPSGELTRKHRAIHPRTSNPSPHAPPPSVESCR
jgi:hypothetical protein